MDTVIASGRDNYAASRSIDARESRLGLSVLILKGIEHHGRISRLSNPFAGAMAIELLARETHTALAKVQEVFLVEYKKLAAHAHITSYLPLLACNSVRGILESTHSDIEVKPAR